MKALEQARPNLPQKPVRSNKQAVKGTTQPEPEMFNGDDNTEIASAATGSKSGSTASGKAVNKACKPNSSAASSVAKKVQFLFHPLIE